jgi:hypothetical protein
MIFAAGSHRWTCARSPHGASCCHLMRLLLLLLGLRPVPLCQGHSASAPSAATRDHSRGPARPAGVAAAAVAVLVLPQRRRRRRRPPQQQQHGRHQHQLATSTTWTSCSSRGRSTTLRCFRPSTFPRVAAQAQCAQPLLLLRWRQPRGSSSSSSSSRSSGRLLWRLRTRRSSIASPQPALQK